MAKGKNGGLPTASWPCKGAELHQIMLGYKFLTHSHQVRGKYVGIEQKIDDA